MPHNDNNARQDQGRQERRFWILGGKGKYPQFALDRRAEEFQTPAEYVMDSAHAGREIWEQSFLEIQPENVWVLAVKQAEHHHGSMTVRIQERAGSACNASLVSAALGLNATVNLRPWEIKTLLIRRSTKGAEVSEVSLLDV